MFIGRALPLSFNFKRRSHKKSVRLRRRIAVLQSFEEAICRTPGNDHCSPQPIDSQTSPPS